MLLPLDLPEWRKLKPDPYDPDADEDEMLYWRDMWPREISVIAPFYMRTIGLKSRTEDDDYKADHELRVDIRRMYTPIELPPETPRYYRACQRLAITTPLPASFQAATMKAVTPTASVQPVSTASEQLPIGPTRKRKRTVGPYAHDEELYYPLTDLVTWGAKKPSNYMSQVVVPRIPAAVMERGRRFARGVLCFRRDDLIFIRGLVPRRL